MIRHRVLPLALALALGSIATTASAAYVTYRDVYVAPASTEYVVVERVDTPRVVSYENRYVVSSTPASEPVSSYYVQPRETILVQAEPVVMRPAVRDVYAHYDPRHPHWGHLIDHGLFNRTGPNDFGR